ncbi:shikimate kinase [Hirschia litorea]|uniref:Shikimate kinase n=1 Tax=Hirschia litorea TaxID=1199156 RepID=A0ABW2IKF4_9PROT
MENDQKAANAHSTAHDPNKCTIVLVGIMGAGKSSVGRRLAQALGIPFHDSDDEVEKAASMKIPEIFAKHGEEEFRRGESSVIKRLLDEPRMVLATGGGAFMNEATRQLMQEKAVTVWLKADLETLWRRVSKKGGRPLLKKQNPKQVLADLLTEREPVYALADYEVVSVDGPHKITVEAVRSALNI